MELILRDPHQPKRPTTPLKPVAIPKPAAKPSQPLPRDLWPLFIRAVALRAIPADKGVGDTFKRLAAVFGGEKYKRWMKKHGRNCGCESTQAAWNARYPL